MEVFIWVKYRASYCSVLGKIMILFKVDSDRKSVALEKKVGLFIPKLRGSGSSKERKGGPAKR